MKAFTLIELLVTVAIVGILASMALMQFNEYRAKAYDSLALSQVRDALTAFESVADRTSSYAIILYPNGEIHGTTTNLSQVLPGFTHTDGVYLTLNYTAYSPADSYYGTHRYNVSGSHCNGSLHPDPYGAKSRRMTYRYNEHGVKTYSRGQIDADSFSAHAADLPPC